MLISNGNSFKPFDNKNRTVLQITLCKKTHKITNPNKTKSHGIQATNQKKVHTIIPISNAKNKKRALYNNQQPLTYNTNNKPRERNPQIIQTKRHDKKRDSSLT